MPCPLLSSPPQHASIRRDGHLYAFGNTEDDYRTTVLGRPARAGDRPFDHDTGTGRVKAHKGQYANALAKNIKVLPAIVESFGGTCHTRVLPPPPPGRHTVQW